MVRAENPDDFLSSFIAMSGLIVEASDKDEIERETGRLPRRSARHREERSGLPVGISRALCLLPVVGWVERHRVVIM